MLSLWAVVESAAVSAVTPEKSDKSAMVCCHFGQLWRVQRSVLSLLRKVTSQLWCAVTLGSCGECSGQCCHS